MGEMARDQAVAKYRPLLPTQLPAKLRYDLIGRRADAGRTLRDKKSGRFPVKKSARPRPAATAIAAR